MADCPRQEEDKARPSTQPPPAPTSPSTAQPPGATLLHSSKYSAASSDGAGGTAVAETWYNTSNILPSAEGVRAFERLTEQTALSNATSGNERVRSNFANKVSAEPQCAGRECVRTAKCVSSNILARQTDQDTF